jgi:hypothetical protein
MHFNGNIVGFNSCKLTVRPWQMGVGRLVKPLRMGSFQGRTVNLSEGKSPFKKA